ncbi:Eco57I restriction-modification methylase domain-containing protein [Clostridium algidicarnis]|uniref:Eco57I restriction-modification methylase domain-containing protein n=1 Tax=Clostridium algidicarnis TaxID=37659 RepID=UPI000497C293|nr:DNA methyltransferase [Clostridium algidicarnis]
MVYLEKELRNVLENSILKARKISEDAAEIAIRQLGVEKSSPYEYLSEQERVLRRRLRAHGRQLGDIRDSKEETQEIDRLIEEVAYEHWHRMLFAKFLFENNLLMYFEDGDIKNAVSISFEECEEIAKELGFYNGWELAAKLAAKMLPQIFRADSPVFELKFPLEKEMELEKIIYGLPKDIFGASDSLGWVYQFWQKNKKDEVNKSEVKIGARELPAVTQLFTEPYMVNFLLDNSLGAWWAKKRLTKEDLTKLKTEEELRDRLKIGSLQFDYIRFVKIDEVWSVAGGNTEGWPENLSEFKLIDPCCGSGHFLVSVFQKLVPIRMYLENITAKEACDKVLSENIHGLEIDQRCVELAAFSIALAAWNYPQSGGFRILPELQIAWCGQSINVKKDDWISLAGEDSDLKFHLEGLYNLFEHAPVLGSLINPKCFFEKGSIFEKEWNRVNKKLETSMFAVNTGTSELSVLAYGMEKSFKLLSNSYHLVITNVPYLTLKRQDDLLIKFVSNNYPSAKYDLSTVFIERLLLFLKENRGVFCSVTPSNWTYLKSYQKFRNYILKNTNIISIANLGEGAFESITGEVVKVLLISLSNNFSKESDLFSGIECKIGDDKKNILKNSPLKFQSQNEQFNNPDQRILLDTLGTNKYLSEFAYSKRGIVNGDNEKWIRYFWEIEDSERWRFLQTSVKEIEDFTGRDQVIDWSTDGLGMLRPSLDNPSYKKKGIAVSRMGDLKATLYTGELYDQNTGVIIPYDEKYITALWCFCKSNSYKAAIRQIDKKLNVTSATLIQCQFDEKYWSDIADEMYPEGLPKAYSEDPTQWIFHGHPIYSTNPLQVAVARLLGFQWPSESDSSLELSDQSILKIQQTEELQQYSDSDGILCIPTVRGEAPASEKLLDILAGAYKGKNITDITTKLLSKNDHEGKSLESWLRDKFFSQHVKLFNNRPFIWQVWDGLPDGFSVLLNYHKLDRKNLETLIYTYLGDWINKQKNDIVTGVDGAEEKLAAAETLKKSLELILNGEQPYDIFVRWKSIDKQPIGWQPDINDGIRLNIRPFMSVPDIGKRGAGILRDKPNINWNKDRGKDTTDSPWYKVFNGERINDYHLSVEEKLSVREEKR